MAYFQAWYFALFTVYANGIHIYQFTFELLPFWFRMWLWVSDLNKNIGGPTDLRKKKGTDRRICIPLFTSPLFEISGKQMRKFLL